MNASVTSDIHIQCRAEIAKLKGHYAFCEEAARRLDDEIARLGAEVEQLRQQHNNDMHTIETGSRANAGLEIENTRLRNEQATWEHTNQWQASEIERLRTPIIRWCIKQLKRNRKLVALIPPNEAHDGPRYAGYYCEDAPEA